MAKAHANPSRLTRSKPRRSDAVASAAPSAARGRVSGIAAQTKKTAATPAKARAEKAKGSPARSAIQPATPVLAVAPMPMAKPTKPSAKLKWPLRPAISAVISGSSTPRQAPAMPSSTCTRTSVVGSVVTAKNMPRSGKVAKAQQQHEAPAAALRQHADGGREQRHDDLGQHDAGGDEQRRLAPRPLGQRAAGQRQHRRIGEGEEGRREGEDHQPAVGEQLGEILGLCSSSGFAGAEAFAFRTCAESPMPESGRSTASAGKVSTAVR